MKAKYPQWRNNVERVLTLSQTARDDAAAFAPDKDMYNTLIEEYNNAKRGRGTIALARQQYRDAHRNIEKLLRYWGYWSEDVYRSVPAFSIARV